MPRANFRVLGHFKMFADISSYGGYPFHEHISFLNLVRKLKVRNLFPIFYINFLFAFRNTAILRHFLRISHVCAISICKQSTGPWCLVIMLLSPDRLRRSPFWNKAYSLFSYFNTILSVTTAVTFPIWPPRLVFAICRRRWQNDLYENKV